MTFYEIFWYFVLYAFLGWCLEVCFCTLDTGKFVNRGFLNGPVCPIYGLGMLAILAALLPLRGSIVALFVGAVLVTSALELSGGWVLKKLFHTSWWDYSDEPFNLGGYICLKFSVAWGVAGVVAVRGIHPAVETLVHTMPRTLGLALGALLLLLLVCDMVVTVLVIAKINHDLGLISTVVHTLRAGSDALSKTLGETALDADGTLDAMKQDATQTFTAVMDKAGEACDAATAAARGAAEKWDTAKGAARDTTRDAVAQLKADWLRHSRAVHRRMLRAFPRMRSTRASSTVALAILRTWLDDREAQKRAGRQRRKK